MAWLKLWMLANMAVLALLVARPVYGEPVTAGQCPADRPIAREVVDYTKPVTCTLMACTGKMICGRLGGPCSVVPTDCNSCTLPPTFIGCFSQDEINRAEAAASSMVLLPGWAPKKD